MLDIYKACLVCKWLQSKRVCGLQFIEVFSHFMKQNFTLILLAMVIVLINVTTTVLHGEFEEIVYIHQQEGFMIIIEQ